jgi:hypothetical protein
MMIRLACRCCMSDELDFLADLRPAYRAGWQQIVVAPVSKYPIPGKWWTHIGTCPRCLKLGAETIEPLSKPSGLMRLFRTAS